MKKEELDKKQLKNTEALVKSVMLLTEQFKMATNPTKAKPGSILSALLGKAKGTASDATSQFKTTHGLLDFAAAKAGGGIMSSVLSTASEVVRGRALEKEAKSKWAAGYLSGTDSGRKLVAEKGEKAAAKIALEKYDKKQEIDKKISEFEDKRKALKDSGVEGANLSKEEEGTIDELKQMLKELLTEIPKEDTKEPIPLEPIKKEGELPAEAIKPVVDTPEKETQTIIPTPVQKEVPEITKQDISSFFMQKAGEEASKTITDPAEHAEFMGGVMQGINEELLKLNEEQLNELKKLVKSSQKSEEDIYESKKEDAFADTHEIDTKKDLKKEDKKDDSIFKDAKDLFSSFKEISGAARGLMSVLRVAGPLLAVAGAGAAGYAAGNFLNDHVINPGMEKLTGNKGETLGTAVYSGVDKIKGMLGFQTDEDKIKEAEKNSNLDLAKKRLQEGKPMAPFLAEALKAEGINVPAEMIIKTPAPRQVQKEVLDTKTQEVEEAKSNNTKSEPSVVNAPTVVNNNNRTTNVIKPDVRNPEPSIRRVYSSNFA